MDSLGVSISGSGVHVPENRITNEQICTAFNAFVRAENERHADEISAGIRAPLAESDAAFVERASGIRARRIHAPEGVLDPLRLYPDIPDRGDDELSVQAEYAVRAAEKALKAAGRCGEDIDYVVCGASAIQRPYPAIAIEVQNALGARGYAFDMLVGCSSSTFAVQAACDALRLGNANCALVVNPEMMTAQTNFGDRDSHFLFGDGTAALVLERSDVSGGEFDILSSRMMTKFSNTIRNNGGFLNRCDPEKSTHPDKLFYQQGRRVFRDVVTMASKFISEHLESLGLSPAGCQRYWLHQANANLNQAVMKYVLGRPATEEEAPLILPEFGNTASSGSLIAFHQHSADLAPGSIGVICSFGAGYSIGSVIVRRR